MRVAVIFPLFLLCVMRNGFSHAQFQSCTISVMLLLVTQNIKEQYRKILHLFHFLTPFLHFSYDSELHLSAISSDKWESHSNVTFIIAPINLYLFFLTNLEECVACSSPLKFLMNMYTSTLDFTKISFTILSSTYSLTNLYLMSTCLVRIVVLTYWAINIAPTLSTCTMMGDCMKIFMLVSIWDTNITILSKLQILLPILLLNLIVWHIIEPFPRDRYLSYVQNKSWELHPVSQSPA